MKLLYIFLYFISFKKNTLFYFFLTFYKYSIFFFLFFTKCNLNFIKKFTIIFSSVIVNIMYTYNIYIYKNIVAQ